MSTNVPEFTVTELSGRIKRTLEDAYGYVRVRGELGRVTKAGSGHVYLDLKDDRAVLSSVIWKGAAARIPIKPEQGMEVIATGRLTTFPGQSRYQLVIDTLEPAGAGALMALLEKRKKELAAEGLFDEGRKKPLPFLPQVIGVVTSPSGAVIRDILHRLRDRFPTHVIVWPTVVQGEGAAPKIVAGIEGFNALRPDGPIPRPDVLIVARGGGSLEDLWCFNDESVVRAAAASDIPLISAVGHETDTTLIDFAADRRAPTPTAAAEMAVPVRLELLQDVEGKGARLANAAMRLAEQRGLRLVAAARGLGRPQALIEPAEQRVDRATERFQGAVTARFDRASARLDAAAAGMRPGRLRDRVGAARDRLTGAATRLQSAPLRRVDQASDRLRAARLHLGPLKRRTADGLERISGLARRLGVSGKTQLADRDRRLRDASRLLESFSYRSVLARGFALVRDEEGAVLRSAEALGAGDRVRLTFEDGDVRATVEEGRASAVKPTRKKRDAKPSAPKEPSKDENQGTAQVSLFDEE